MRLASAVPAVAAILLASSPASAAAKIPISDEAFVNLSLLLQPWAFVQFSGAPNSATCSTANCPSDPLTELYLRRVRVILSGNITKNISFFFDTDMPNYGLRGNFDTAQFFVQDAFASWTLIPEAIVDVGMMLIPASRHGLQGAGSLNQMDYHTVPLLYANQSKVFRDVGIQLRGNAIDNKVHYRFGVFNGASGSVAAGVNPSDVPRLAGLVRYNVLGNDTAGFFTSGIYFAKAPVVSIGAGFQWQRKGVTAVAGLPDNSPKDFLGISGDVFVDWPMANDQELIVNASYFNYGQGERNAKTGHAAFVELGYRIGVIEPTVSMDVFRGSETNAAGGAITTGNVTQFKFGLNYWHLKHTANVKLEAATSKTGDPYAASTKTINQLILQLQLLL